MPAEGANTTNMHAMASERRARASGVRWPAGGAGWRGVAVETPAGRFRNQVSLKNGDRLLGEAEDATHGPTPRRLTTPATIMATMTRWPTRAAAILDTV